MPIDTDELQPRKKVSDIMLGEDLSMISEHELVARVAALETEIARCRMAIAARQSTRNAANSVFRNS
jgi:uncharacterized small protein (DUF1192 family)